jgi:hypothetical protein
LRGLVAFVGFLNQGFLFESPNMWRVYPFSLQHYFDCLNKSWAFRDLKDRR